MIRDTIASTPASAAVNASSTVMMPFKKKGREVSALPLVPSLDRDAVGETLKRSLILFLKSSAHNPTAQLRLFRWRINVKSFFLSFKGSRSTQPGYRWLQRFL